ncbi:MAG: AbrB/MazE/SpoVT family DNA-binding domain-containing protein [Candidatus Bathyarchaeota archaeon]|nr:AbrB/MazE/SpoVT family DNA-binding domain-containing protein [Candidatus Bathyarchaeota archaeon]
MQPRQIEETRKVQFTGGSTYIISLPKKWIDQNNLKKGSVIQLREEEGGALLITATSKVQTQTTEEALIKISPKDNSAAVIRKVVSAYLVGYSLIRIKAEKQQQLSTEQRNNLKNFARHMLVGTEIVTDKPSELTLQVLLSYPELSIQSALRRMGIITASMHRDAITALKTLDYALARSVAATDNEVDRFTLYIVRQLKMAVQNPRIIKDIGLSNARNCLGYRLVAKSVERTADHAVSIAENMLPLRQRLSAEGIKKIEEMSEIAITMFETAVDALLRQDFNLAESIIEKIDRVVSLEKEAVKASQQIGIDEAANLRLIIESVRRTAEYAADIAEIVLNLTVESIISGEHSAKPL